MAKVNRITLANQIILVSAIPLLVILFFAYGVISKEYGSYVSANNLKSALEISMRGIDVVHELQKERGVTAGYIGSKGMAFKNELNSQRARTDEKYYAIVEAYRDIQRDVGTIGFIDTVYAFMSRLDELRSIREKVDTLSISLEDAIEFYSHFNTGYLNKISLVRGEISDARMSAPAGELFYLLNAKELAGRERAVVNSILARNTAVDEALYVKWNGIYYGQEALLESFLLLAKKKTVDFYTKTVTGSAVQEVRHIRNTIRHKAKTGDFGIKASAWYKAATQRINLLGQVSDAQINALRNDTAELLQKARTSLYVYITLTLLVVASVIGLIIYNALSMNRFFKHSIRSISDKNGQIVVTSKQVASSALELAEGAIQQAESVESINVLIARAVELNNLNVSSAFEAGKLAQQANSSAAAGNVSLGRLMESMEHMMAASEKIAKIIKDIDEIASRTNLLAINATVEAARAGKHGYGFSIVAEEVKNLANRTTVSAKETTEIIEEALERIQESNVVARKTHDAFALIVENSERTSAVVSDIASSLKEASDHIQNISNDMGEIDAVTQRNAMVSKETAAAFKELSSDANILMEHVKDVAKHVGTGIEKSLEKR